MGRESLADTVGRIGAAVFVDALRGLPALAWAAGDDDPAPARDPATVRALPLASA